MGLTQKLGTIPLAIFTDASNNIGIGGSPSGSYKFEVTGTARISGAANFGSTITLSTSSTTYGSAFYLANTSNSKQWNFTNVGSGISGRSGNLEINNNASDILAITQTGNVLIGNTSAKWPGIIGLEINGAETILGMKNGTTALGYVYHSGTHMYISNEVIGSADMVFNVNGAARMRITSAGYLWVNGAIISSSGVQMQVNGQSRFGGDILLHNGSNQGQAVRLSCNGADSFYVQGALSKNSGSFRIDHPLESMAETHQLVHSFVEAPQADLYYRGKLTLVNGKGEANIDEAATMTKGTFEALCRDVQCFTTNETGWDLIKGKVIGNIIYIESQNPNSTDEISWLVIGERKDKHMMDTNWTDENGRVIVEPLKIKS